MCDRLPQLLSVSVEHWWKANGSVVCVGRGVFDWCCFERCPEQAAMAPIFAETTPPPQQDTPCQQMLPGPWPGEAHDPTNRVAAVALHQVREPGGCCKNRFCWLLALATLFFLVALLVAHFCCLQPPPRAGCVADILGGEESSGWSWAGWRGGGARRRACPVSHGGPA